MSAEYCPRCRKVEAVSVSESIRVVQSPPGKTKKVRVRVYHCQHCGGFIRSEQGEELAPPV